jgi:hypothetical protein
VTQPDYVPLQESDRIRPSMLLPAPSAWLLGRPGDETGLDVPTGPRFGSTGPDLGYGLKLARRFEEKLVLEEGDHAEDVVAGCFGCGARRSSHFGRAPVIYDMEWAYTLWGYLAEAPADLVEHRRPLFRGAAEHYWDQRAIAGAVRPETLSMTPAQVRDKLQSWKDLLII